MENTNFLFNEASGRYREKLTPEQNEFLAQTAQKAKEQVEQLDADHHTHKDQRIADQEKALLQHYKAQLNMPRPPNVPAPRLKTAAEIRSEAESRVQRGHAEARQRIITEARKTEREYIKKTLGIEPRGPNGPDHGIDRT